MSRLTVGQRPPARLQLRIETVREVQNFVQESHGFLQSLVYGLGAALGFSLVMVLFAGMRERINAADVPAPFQGASIALITAGLMALGFMGFAGLVKG